MKMLYLFLLVTPLLLCAQQLGMGDGLEDRLVQELLREDDIWVAPVNGVRVRPAPPLPEVLLGLGDETEVRCLLRGLVLRQRYVEREDPNEGWRLLLQAVWALGRLEDRGSVSLLRDLLLDGGIQDVARGRMTEALARIDPAGSRAALASLVRRCPTDSPHLIEAAAEALASASGADAAEAMEACQGRVPQPHLRKRLAAAAQAVRRRAPPASR